MVSKENIQEIYDKYVKVNYTEAYLNKYSSIPMELNNKKWKWEGKDFVRIIALLEFREYILELDRVFEDVLSFSSVDIWGVRDPEYDYLQYKNHHNFNYEDDIKYDLHYLELEKKDFDFIMLTQVIEHLYNPILALKNIYNHLKIGGIIYASVPVNNIPHSTPFHFYTGVTPVGLGMMMQLAGFDILKIGQWGNEEYLHQLYGQAELTWPDYTYCENPGRNEIEHPVGTWCFAKKKI